MPIEGLKGESHQYVIILTIIKSFPIHQNIAFAFRLHSRSLR
jgi:hypothetical protein